MPKIEEFEKKLIENGLYEEDYAEYEKLLKRVNGNSLRLQHCYATAVKFPKTRSEQAIALIEWGLEKYPDTWFTTYSAYYNMGQINEKANKYQLAYDSYLKADSVLGEEQLSYHQALCGNLLWMLLHIDHFHYSEKLEEYYQTFNRINLFQKAFINSEFRIVICEIVIDLHYGETDKAVIAHEEAVRLSAPDAASKMQGILERHNTKDKLTITPECTAFLESIKI